MENTLPIKEIIRQAKARGVDFGNGEPTNRLRYYSKVGLLPKASRKTFKGQIEGCYPTWVIDRLLEIDKKLKEGKSIQIIAKELSLIDQIDRVESYPQAQFIKTDFQTPLFAGSKNELLPISGIIKLAQLKGVDFGKGNSANRLRYYSKIGLIPAAVRKKFNGKIEGAYPVWVVDLLLSIDQKQKEGKSIQIIAQEIKDKPLPIPVGVDLFVPEIKWSTNPRLLLSIMSLSLIVSLSFFIFSFPKPKSALNYTTNQVSNYIKDKAKPFFKDYIKSTKDQISQPFQEVLAARTTEPFFNINVETEIKELLAASGGIITNGQDANLATGRLTASNVIYDIIAGTNVIVSSGQRPTISVPSVSAQISGTSGRITISAGTPQIIDIDTSYVGQTSITTLGTISTGTWNGTVISDSYVADDLTISSSGNVVWSALTSYPSSCGSGNFIRAVADTLACAADTGGTGTLQDAYDNSSSPATIETASAKPLLITETTAAASTHDLFQLTGNPATGGTFSGDLLQLTLDAVDANGFTGNGIHIIVDQSQNTGNLFLAEDDGGSDLLAIDESGNIDMNNNLISNIGNAGTDFTSGGGLAIGGTAILDVNPTITIAVGATGTIADVSGTLDINSPGFGLANTYGLRVNPPTVTETLGGVSTAASLYIPSAPSTSGSDYSLFVDDGESRFDGTLTANGDSIFNNDVDFVLGNGSKPSENFFISAGFLGGEANFNLVDIDVDDNKTVTGFEEHILALNITPGGWTELNDANDSILDIYLDAVGLIPTGYRSGLRIVAEDPPSSTNTVTDAILITTVDDEGGTVAITDAIDASNSNITNALNVGNNKIKFYQVGSNYIELQNRLSQAGQVHFVDDAGNSLLLVVDNGSTGTVSTTTLQASFATASTAGLCWDNLGPSDIFDCSGAPTDYAEYYPVQTDVEEGDLVSTSTVTVSDVSDFLVSRLTKSSQPYDPKLIGIVSTQPGHYIGDQSIADPKEIIKPIALSGRVPTKVSTENGPIQAGDPLTSSSLAGVAMKATSPGRIIGIALEAFSPQSRDYRNNQILNIDPNTLDNYDRGKILVFVNLSYYLGDSEISQTINSYQSDYQKLPSDITDQELIDASGSAKILAIATESAKATPISTSSSQPNLLSIVIEALKSLGVNVKNAVVYLAEASINNLTIKRLYVDNEIDPSIGEAKILAGQTQVVIENNYVKENSKIFLSFRGRAYDLGWAIKEFKSGKSFTIEISKPAPADLVFDYWIIQTTATSNLQPTFEPTSQTNEIQTTEPQPKSNQDQSAQEQSNISNDEQQSESNQSNQDQSPQEQSNPSIDEKPSSDQSNQEKNENQSQSVTKLETPHASQSAQVE